MEENKISYEGQNYPMWFQYKMDGIHTVIDIASVEDPIGLQINLFRLENPIVKVVEILETRDKNRTGKNYFRPDAKFYRVKAIPVN